MTDIRENSQGKNNRDRVREYFIPYLDEYIFDQLTDDYLTKVEMTDILKDVPVPFKKTELGNLTGINMARSMAFVLGCDPGFLHGEKYLKFINRAFGDDFIKPLIGEGLELAEKGEYKRAAVLFRAALKIKPDDSDALYCYARSCKDCYEEGDGEEYVGNFKAESLEAFEKLTMISPEFEMGYYYLAYAYMNLGLYTKAKLTFENFLKLTDDEHFAIAFSRIPKDSLATEDEMRSEWKALREDVISWVGKLEEPVKIEAAYNEVLAGRYAQGIAMLEPYEDREEYNKWWPLYFYLGISYEQLADWEKASLAYKRILELSPSNTDAMEGLVRVGTMLDDREMVSKYSEKIKVVQRNREEERAERNKDMS